MKAKKAPLTHVDPAHYGTRVPHAFTDPLSSAPNRGSCRPGLVLHYTYKEERMQMR